VILPAVIPAVHMRRALIRSLSLPYADDLQVYLLVSLVIVRSSSLSQGDHCIATPWEAKLWCGKVRTQFTSMHGKVRTQFMSMHVSCAFCLDTFFLLPKLQNNECTPLFP